MSDRGHILVLGGGVTGVASAYFLARRGFQVTLVEAQPGVGLETSFANGGQQDVGFSRHDPCESIAGNRNQGRLPWTPHSPTFSPCWAVSPIPVGLKQALRAAPRVSVLDPRGHGGGQFLPRDPQVFPGRSSSGTAAKTLRFWSAPGPCPAWFPGGSRPFSACSANSGWPTEWSPWMRCIVKKNLRTRR